MDRQTVLRIGEEGVWFTNGLRKVHLPWGDIQSVQVSPSQLGDRIQVQGESRYFAFRTLAEVMVKGELKGRMGFTEGEQILQVIIQQSGLKEKDHLGANTYYVRR